MNQNAQELQEQILQRASIRKELIKTQKKELEDFDDETTSLQNQLELAIQHNNPQIKAAEAWCRLTNALIYKYKHMAEVNPKLTVEEINKIEDFLLLDGFLTKEDLDKAL